MSPPRNAAAPGGGTEGGSNDQVGAGSTHIVAQTTDNDADAPRCRRCHRTLSLPASIHRGLGRKCSHHAEQEPADIGPKAAPIEVDIRKRGLLRLVYQRNVSAYCACGATFRSTGTAASHAAATKHTVNVNYSTSFQYVQAADWRAEG